MCGIAGFIDLDGHLADPGETLAVMAKSLHHRGPDDSGTWFDPAVGVGLAHARLSIIDLSSLGHQPMVSGSGRLVISFNGEIYNFTELRKELESNGCRLRGHSDTEVLLSGIEHYGLHAMLDRCVGMFAFALWDREERQLHLVRDRFGIKPLYWSQDHGRVIFGSELKPLYASGLVDSRMDKSSVASLLRFAYVPSPFSILEGVAKLEPGCIASIKLDAEGRALPARMTRYWCSIATAKAARSEPFEGGLEELTDVIEGTLRTAIIDRMVSDVPLGAFLSGGIDSSLVVALMQEASPRPVRTFTIGFDEAAYDESNEARRISRHLGTDHVEMIVRKQEAIDVIPKLPTCFDEPFADSSQIPTCVVSKLAREHVTVSLSGDGGDELFGGYDRYSAGVAAWRRFRSSPRILGALLKTGACSLSVSRLNQLYGLARRATFGRLPRQAFGQRVHKLSAVISAEDEASYYRLVMSNWLDPSEATRAEEHPSVLFDPELRGDLSFEEYMFLADTRSYLVDDILTKVDRASMSVSLEARVPMLDHRVFDAAWRLPMSMRMGGSTGKVVLRKILERRVPSRFFERPKMGFAVPIDDWLRGPLRDWTESLLDVPGLEEVGLDANSVRAVWRDHLKGGSNRTAQLWPVLMLRAWHDQWMKDA
jgi:asparagine synthase (glutamine-hydrolysing)